MRYLIESWPLLVALLAMGGLGCVYIREFADRPTSEQLAAVKEWLLWAVTNAEKELGGGTGRLKLRMVYDWFVQRFPTVSQAVSFEMFSGWVDEALEQMRQLLKSNAAVQEYVERTHDKGESGND